MGLEGILLDRGWAPHKGDRKIFSKAPELTSQNLGVPRNNLCFHFFTVSYGTFSLLIRCTICNDENPISIQTYSNKDDFHCVVHLVGSTWMNPYHWDGIDWN